MPLYEYRKNAENWIPFTRANPDDLVCGNAAVATRILAEATGLSSLVIDGWYGVDWPSLIAAVEKKVDERIMVGSLFLFVHG